MSVISGHVYLTYVLDGVLYWIVYYSNGKIEKIARTIGSDIKYSINSNANTVVTSNIQDNRLDYSNEENQTMAVNEENTTRASRITVSPLEYTADPDTAPYVAKVVQSGRTTLYSLSAAGYNSVQEYKIYETMTAHSPITTSKIAQAYNTGTTIAEIAAAFTVAPTTVLGWLNLAGVLLNAANEIQNNIEVLERYEYSYYGGKECGIYDPTSVNGIVEVYETFSKGVITLVWSYNSSSGFYNPDWGHSSRSDSLKITNSTILTEAVDIYNVNIEYYGYWKWGVGNGFGY